MKFNRAIFVTTILSAVTFVSCGSYGEQCGEQEDLHCATGVGLICHEEFKNCTCASGRFEQNLKSKQDYKMEWSNDLSRCVGVEDSLCVGTRQNPKPESVICLPTLTCVQIPEQSLGFGTCKSIPKNNSHNSDCDQNNHCDASAGLICGETKKCECGNGALDHEHSYSLTWDDERHLCVATPGSACVGTQLNPLPAGGERRVECESGICTQLDGKPPGVGICRSGEEGTSSTTPESTTAGAASTTLATFTFVFVIFNVCRQF